MILFFPRYEEADSDPNANAMYRVTQRCCVAPRNPHNLSRTQSGPHYTPKSWAGLAQITWTGLDIKQHSSKPQDPNKSRLVPLRHRSPPHLQNPRRRSPPPAAIDAAAGAAAVADVELLISDSAPQEGEC
ncbi:hypothetical protein Droror1_Dr00011289 [Drosera rotundifolia]